MLWIVKALLSVLTATTAFAAPATQAPSPWHLVMSQDAAQVAGWTRTLDGYDCRRPGRVTLSHGSAAFSVDGSTGQCAEVTYYGRSYRYGLFEARMYLPGSNGHIADWPAFWMVGQPERMWPAIGEDDIAEGLHGQVCPGFHWKDNGKVGTTGNHCQAWVRPGWHTFGVDWERGYLAWYYDGRPVLTVRAAYVTSAPEVMRLNITTGKYGMLPGVPATMRVRWVRVWQK